MEEQTKKWRQELGLPDPEPTELELLLQKWEQAEEARLSAALAREAPESPAPEELLQGEQEEETVPEPEEVSTTPPPQLQTTTPEEDPALVSAVPCPLLLDTLPVFLDLPALGLEPRNLHHQSQLCPWFPTPLSPNTQTSLGCCQTSLVLPLFAAKLPLGDRISLRRSPGEDLCPLLHSPVHRLSLRSPLSSRWGPKSQFQGPVLEAPEEPTHPQARPCKRAKIDICGLEAYTPEPVLIREPAGEIFEGDTVTLSCVVEGGSGGWRYLWYKDRQGAPVYQTDSSSGTGAGYTISAAALSHSGEYWCGAGWGRNMSYSQYSHPIWVNVTGSFILIQVDPVVYFQL
ncbi:UNVERIFIED_CONTAM: hypothetical protein FKN15_072265 [Acipenser sinensis]